MRLNRSSRLLKTFAVTAALGLSAFVGLLRPDAAARAQPAAAAVPPAVPPADRPDAPPIKAEEKEAPGVAVTFASVGGAAGVSDTRSARLVALYVPAGEAPSSLVPAGPFTATFEGAVNLRLRDTYAFSAEGRGKVTVLVNDKEALTIAGDDFSKAPAADGVRLNKGKNKLVVKYESPATGDASLRLLWTLKNENYAYPVDPIRLSHNAGAEAIARDTRLRDGRQLLADLRCIKCHTLPGADKSAFAELNADAPDLSQIGSRLNKDWLTIWIDNPHALRPNPHMPRLFASAGADAGPVDPRSADVAAYLATLVDPAAPAALESTEEKIARGGQLFTHLNCAACHEPPAAPADATADGAAPPPADPNADAAAGEDAPPARVPLKYVKAKFQPAALVAFLKNPAAHYAWIPMPNFKFTAPEAEAVACFLLSEASAALPENLPAGDAIKGKALLASAGCINCHAVGQEKSTLNVLAFNAIPKDAWSTGCLAADDANRNTAPKTAPKYELTDAQRQAMVAVAATDRTLLYHDAPAEFAARQVEALNCAGCHARDGKESFLVTAYDAEHQELMRRFPAPKGEHAESFSPDQRPPLMTWFGEKLRPQWAQAFLAGQIDYKPRPYLHARMPAFASRAKLLATGLAAEHGVAPTAPEPPAPDAPLAAIGSKLAGKTPNMAFQCTQCHAVAQAPPFAPFEAPAINFAHSAQRLRKDYYHRWVHNPLALDPNTKMPAFEREDGKTTITTILEGDARKQFEAIWQYILEGKNIKPPAE